MRTNRILTGSASLLIAAMVGAPASAQLGELIWSDEFDGTELNLNNWEYMIGDGSAYGIPGWGNNELQYYTDQPNNISVGFGNLFITAQNQFFDGRAFTSARIRSLNLQDFQYGRIEARMQLPSTPGIWPAFWMLPTNSPYGGWAAGGEIDIMESVNFADRIYGTLHFGGQFPANTSYGSNISNGTDYSIGFHTFAIEWEPDLIRWFVNGENFHTASKGFWFSNAAPGNDRAPFDNPFHLLLNVAVGGNFPGDPNGASVFPQTMVVDYVRVYSLEQAPYSGTPAAIPGLIEAEDFDIGYFGEAYSDSDVVNEGGAYRGSGVDLENCSEGGFNVGFIRPGEWIEYTVDVAQAGDYELEARVASQSAGGRFRLEFDGVDKTGEMIAPSTGGWQTWTTISVPVTLDAGEQVMRFQHTGSSGQQFNVNHFNLVSLAPDCPADVNGDGTASPADFTAWLGCFNNPASAPFCDRADVNASGAIDPADFTAWLAAFNAGCP